MADLELAETLAKAEARLNAMDLAHRPASTGTRLHEFAGTDALVSIVAAMAGLSLLGIERVECSPLNVGGGFLKTPAGVQPVPAPAAAEILREASVPLYGTDSNGELVTAVGAAIIASVASAFGPMPSVTIDGLGYGVSKDGVTENAGALRVNTYRFFVTLFVTRLIRFGAESVLALFYGRQIVRWFQSDTFEYMAYFLFGAAMLGTTLAVIQLIRSTRRTGHKTRRRAA